MYNSLRAVRDGVRNAGTTPGAKSEARVEDKMSNVVCFMYTRDLPPQLPCTPTIPSSTTPPTHTYAFQTYLPPSLHRYRQPPLNTLPGSTHSQPVSSPRHIHSTNRLSTQHNLLDTISLNLQVPLDSSISAAAAMDISQAKQQRTKPQPTVQHSNRSSLTPVTWPSSIPMHRSGKAGTELLRPIRALSS